MKIQTVPAASLTAYEKNSRRHPEAQIEALAGSIERFGFVGAIVVRNGSIAKGHGALAAARRLLDDGRRIYPAPGAAAGAKPLPLGHVPVIDASGWTDAQFRAFVIADNKLAEMSEWDMPALQLEIDALMDLGEDIETLGFDDAEIDELMNEFTDRPSFQTLDNAAASESDRSGDKNIDLENAGEEDVASKTEKVPPIFIPIIINLSVKEMAVWRELKKNIGFSDNSEAFKHMTGIVKSTDN